MTSYKANFRPERIDPYKVTILGGGAWGSALACVMRRANHDVSLWSRDISIVNNILKQNNPHYLPDITLPDGIQATQDPSIALTNCHAILAAIPAQSLRNVLQSISSSIPPGIPFILCAKGIETKTGMRLSQLASSFLPNNPLAVLSGPSFACDVARNLPTSVVIACNEPNLASILCLYFSTPSFRCYSSNDIAGVEIGGALKNVFAIASGAIIGASLGESARSAMVARAIVELQRLACVFGGSPETIAGLSGIGDLFLTCSSSQSRNFSYGVALARGESLAQLPLAEGVPTTFIAAEIARKERLETPVLFSVERVLERSITIREAVNELMMRPLRPELESA